MSRDSSLRLYVGPMEAVLVDFAPDGRVRFDGEDWSSPTLQEARAILYAARQEIERLEELVAALDRPR